MDGPQSKWITSNDHLGDLKLVLVTTGGGRFDKYYHREPPTMCHDPKMILWHSFAIFMTKNTTASIFTKFASINVTVNLDNFDDTFRSY